MFINLLVIIYLVPYIIIQINQTCRIDTDISVCMLTISANVCIRCACSHNHFQNNWINIDKWNACGVMPFAKSTLLYRN